MSQLALADRVTRIKESPSGAAADRVRQLRAAGEQILSLTVGEPDFDKRIALVQQIEKKVLTDLPDMGIITLSYVIARSPRVDLGYEVKSGYAYWPLHRAKYA